MRWFVILFGVLAFATGARAQGSEAEAESRQLYAEGRAAAENGRWAAAHAAFERGWELSERPLFLFNMAEASRLGGADARAREEYAQYLEHEPTGDVADDARARLEALGGPPPRPSPDGDGREDDAAPPDDVSPRNHEPATSEAPSPEETARAGAPASSEPPSTVAPAAPPPEGGGSLLESWVFWGVVGLVVAGGVTAAILLSGDGSEPFDPQCGMGCAVLDFSMD